MRGVRARGNSILLTFSYRGIQCRETLRLEPTKYNLAFAKKKLANILFQIEIGKFEYSEHFQNSRTKSAKLFSSEFNNRTTIEDSLINYLKTIRKKIQLSTQKSYCSAINYHLIPRFGRLKLNELTVQMIEEWISEVDISNKRINNVLIPLKAVYQSAYRQGFLQKNPFDLIHCLPTTTREPLPLTPYEVQKVLNELEGQAKNYIKFAFWTGLRTSELIALKWSDLNTKNSSIHITRAKVLGIEKTTKTTAGKRTVKLLSGAIEALNSQKKYTFNTCEYIFNDPRTNQPWKNDQAIRKIFWYPALKRAGLTKRTVYQTRHTYASLALSKGENFMWVSKQMGHDKPATTLKSYGRYIQEVDEKSGIKLENAFNSTS